MVVSRYAREVVDKVMSGEMKLREAVKEAEARKPVTKPRLKKERTLEEVVAIRFRRFMNHFPMTQHREVKQILGELL